MFDATTYADAFKPPTFKDLDGTEYVGRLLGADTWFELQPSLRIVDKDGNPDGPAIERATYRIISTMFPQKWWKFGPSKAVKQIYKLPPRLRVKAFMDFMHSQDQWIRGRLSPRSGSFPVTSPNSGAAEDPSPAYSTAGA